jgi:glycosyltransferase involved in cell wall biosynthesis
MKQDHSFPQSVAVTEEGADILAFVNRTEAAPLRRVALIGGFAPRKCGIATFTTDIFEQLGSHQPRLRIDVWALRDVDGPPSDGRVHAEIDSDDREALVTAARAINADEYDAVWLQHEYGIYGGDCGEMVLDFAEHVAAPLIVTLHTVLTEPSEAQRRILARLVALSARVMVMSRHSRDLLIERYGVDPGHVAVIEHGAPERPYGRRAEYKRKMGLGDRPVLMTFGLLGPGKGIETMISALPSIVARHPETLYRIVGATHPNLVAREGEAYRERLEALAAELGVSANVAFDNRFLDTDELLDQLEACDVYVTPYFNLEQSTSGTLSYAVALGKAVVSTPYVHARELLANGVGTLVEPRSAEALSEAVLGLLDHPEALERQSRTAYDRGRETIWPRFAEAGAALIESVAISPPTRFPSTASAPSFSAVEAMSDATGMLQHGIGIIPDRRHGYCLDDNVRALMLALLAHGQPRARREALAGRNAAFIQHAWNPDRGHFRNFMNFDRTWCEEVGSEDSNGRTVWALGVATVQGFDADWRSWGRRWFDVALSAMTDIASPRSIAFGMLGCAAVQRAGIDHAASREYLESGGAILHRLLEASRRPDWAWFETVLGYDNPRLSQALIEAGELLGRADWRRAGLESLAWIAEQQIAASGHFRPIGSEGFGREHLSLPFDQQPLEAWAAIEAAAAAYTATQETRWLDHARTAYRWFFGANDRGVVLADLATGRCRDGVTPRGSNENCGAESILAFQLAHYALAALLRDTQDSGLGEDFGPGARPAFFANTR